MRHHSRLFRLFLYMWVAPWSLWGLLLGLLGLATGGAAVRIDGTLEFHGGMLPWMLRIAPITGGASAITLGHTVLGRTLADLERCRDHEQIHVRQYERWGPLFVPAYFLASFDAWRQGLDPYRDNVFEKEAFEGSELDEL